MSLSPLLPKPYLVVTEFDGIGYLIDTFFELEEAESKVNYLIAEYRYNNGALHEQQKGYRSYRVHSSAVYSCGSFIKQVTDGSYSAMVYSSCQAEFSIDNFIFERENTVYAIDIDLVNIDNRFVKDYHPDLLAN
ncbi:MAG: hypothetical protein JSS76_16590 [Bacteroidetes bacterium]|nr:hypothetical protein [Bacteroidota bacterium]